MLVAVTHDLSCEPSAVARARQWLRDTLRPHLTDPATAPELLDDAVLCLSELVTNALNAGCAVMTVTVQVEPDSLRIGLADDAPGLPRQKHPGPEDARGRGLLIVDALAHRWGVDVAQRGKQTWASWGIDRPTSA